MRVQTDSIHQKSAIKTKSAMTCTLYSGLLISGWYNDEISTYSVLTRCQELFIVYNIPWENITLSLFTDEKTETQRRDENYLRSHVQKVEKPGFELTVSGFISTLLITTPYNFFVSLINKAKKRKILNSNIWRKIFSHHWNTMISNIS